MGLAIAAAGAGVVTAVPLDEVKQHLQMDLTKHANDDELTRFITVAETAIGHRTGPLTLVTVTEKHNGGGTCIVLRNPRAVSLTSVAYADGSTGALGDFDLDTDTAILHCAYGTGGSFPTGTRFVTVSYTAGFAPLPVDIAQAVKELVRHLWKTQRGASTGARPGFDDSQDPVPGAFSSWPIRVQELLEPYLVPAVA